MSNLNDLCNILCDPSDEICNTVCEGIKNCPITLNEVYTVTKNIKEAIPTVIKEIPEQIKNAIMKIVIQTIIWNYLPWVLIYIAAIIIMTTQGMITFNLALILIIVGIIIVAISIIFLIEINKIIIEGGINNIKKKIEDNWNRNKANIIKRLTSEYTNVYNQSLIACPSQS